MAKFYTDAFFSPKFHYMRRFVLFGGFIAGYKIAINMKTHHFYTDFCNNYSKIPKEVREAVCLNDARYAHSFQKNK